MVYSFYTLDVLTKRYMHYHSSEMSNKANQHGNELTQKHIEAIIASSIPTS